VGTFSIKRQKKGLAKQMRCPLETIIVFNFQKFQEMSYTFQTYHYR